MKKGIAVTAICVLMLMPGIRAQINMDLFDAYGNYYSGNYTQAIISFDKLISENKNLRPDFVLFRGIAKYKAGYYQQALDDLSLAAGLDQPYAFFWMAHCYVFLADFSESISCLKKYLQLSPSPNIPELKRDTVFRVLHSSDAWFGLWQQDWRTASQETIDEAQFLAEKQNYTGAHSVIEKNLNEGSIELYLYNSRLYADENNMELALNELNRALEFDPDNLDLLRQKADFLMQTKNYKEAYTLLGKILTIVPEDFPSRYLHAAAALYSGNISAARQDITLYLKYFDSEDAIFLAGKIAYTGGQYLEALRYFNQLLERNTANAQYFKARGMTYYQTRTLTQAAFDLSMSLDLVPDDAETNYYLGLTQDLLGNKKMACYYLNRAYRYGEPKAYNYTQQNCMNRVK
jgi:tetratricopeptide (TPR) repeat protein